MFFSRNAVGIDITQHGVRMVSLGGKQDAPKLLSYGSAEFPQGTLRLLHREPNVVAPAAFVNTVRETYLRLLSKTGLVSVSLPDAAGRVVILDLETRFRSKEEGRDMIRWKLKKSLPVDMGDIHLDFQTLREKESGELSVLVAIVARPIVTQYEDLLIEAGLQPNRIDFTTFNLCRLFARRLEMSENALFVALHDGALSILIFNQGVIEFHRTKDLGDAEPDMNRIFMETNSSLLFYRDKNPGHEIREAFYLAPEGRGELLGAVISEACGLDPLMLAADRFIAVPDGLSLPAGELASLSAALGAGARNL